ncbi:MAG: HEAT repeat domain-containing protein [Candidatus Riflebacteria bacterium]|nr:HEAT repeat domain-containing protein [Candidatus Riflebacteria bacterium]
MKRLIRCVLVVVCLSVFSFTGALLEASADAEIDSQMKLLASENPGAANEAAMKLSKMGKPALKELIAALKLPMPAPKWAAWSLGLMKDEGALEGLSEAMKSENEKIRSFAIAAIGEIGGEKAFKILVSHVDVEAAPNRGDAVFALAKNADKSNLEYFRKWLKDAEPAVRSEAVKAVGKLVDKESFGTLAEMMSTEKDPAVRQRLVIIITSLGDSTISASVRSFLQKPEEEVKINTLSALEALKDRESVSEIKKLLETETSEKVKEAAQKALKTLESVQ